MPTESVEPREPRWWDGVPWKDVGLFLAALLLGIAGMVAGARSDQDRWLWLMVPFLVGYPLRWLWQDGPEYTRRNRAAVKSVWRRLRRRA